jgi:hypothetical protein
MRTRARGIASYRGDRVVEYYGSSTRFSDFRALRVRADALGRFYARPLLGVPRGWAGGERKLGLLRRVGELRFVPRWAMGFGAISLGLLYFYLSH